MAHIPRRMGSSALLRLRLSSPEGQDNACLQHLLLYPRPTLTVRPSILPLGQWNYIDRDNIQRLSNIAHPNLGHYSPSSNLGRRRIPVRRYGA